MFSGIATGRDLAREALRAYRRYPALFAPVLGVYALCAVFGVLWWRLLDSTDGPLGWLIIFGAIASVSVIQSLACFVLLEQVRRIETGAAPTVVRASVVALANTGLALPIVLLWALTWLAITIAEIIITAVLRDGADDIDLTDGLIAGGMGALRKGARMIALEMFPSIAWQHTGPIAAMRRGLSILAAHKQAFAVGFTMTQLLLTLLAVPLIAIFLVTRFGVVIPDGVWIAAVAYGGFIWCVGLQMEQLFVAELYAWHLAWERERDAVAAIGVQTPPIEAVSRPSIMDGVPDLRGLPA